MARTYRRSANGRFAGGSGGSSGGKGGSGSRAVGKAGSKGVARPRVASKKISLATRAKRGAKKTGKFLKNHPELVVAGAYSAASLTMSGTAVAVGAHNRHKMRGATAANVKFARNVVARKRGLPSPASTLKAARRTVRGVHKITSMK